MNENRWKKIIFILNMVLFLGLLSYCVILFVLSKTRNSAYFSINDELLHQRFWGRWLAEKICSLCSAVYIIGHIAALYSIAKKSRPLPLKPVCFYFIIQIGILFLCVIPFALLDTENWGDYLFPIWNIIVMLCFLLLAFIFTVLYKRKKHAG